jgi:hypothetical protein
MKRIAIILSLIIGLFVIFQGCEKDNDDENYTGILSLSLTDAPVDLETIDSINLEITGIEYNKAGGSWTMVEDYGEPKTYNILNLTDGTSELIGEFPVEAGRYTQLRFLLNAPDYSESPNQSNPGCYVVFKDGTVEPLFVSSGGETGYKAVGEFVVPINGSVSVTADFDARKSILKEAGASGMFVLKPTIRLIVDNEAGAIAGNLLNTATDTSYVVYAYEDGTYETSESDDPATGEPRFPNAVTSDQPNDANHYRLSYLAPATYDIVVASFIDTSFQDVVGIVEDVSVTSEKVTNKDIDISNL